MTGKELALAAAAAAARKKANDVRVLDLQGVFGAADYFVICSGWNTPQLQAITREVEEELERQGVAGRRQGTPESQWVLLDCGDVVIHIFSEEARQFYLLERLWGEAQVVSG
jgi:ribosome-associated protein